jgi:hypothetical protein
MQNDAQTAFLERNLGAERINHITGGRIRDRAQQAESGGK